MTDKKSRLRHILTMMPLRPIRSLRTPQANHGTFQPDQVCIHTFTNGALQLPWCANLSVEKVCTKAADACNVPPLTANLFGLYDETNRQWLCPSARIEQPTPGQQSRLVYKLRFHTSATSPSGESSGFLQLEESVVNYMFCQYRERFLQDDIKGLSTEESLGLVVLDFMQHVKHENIPLANLNGRLRFGRFLPKSLNDGLSWWDKRKLRRKVRTALTDFREDSREAFAFKVMFLVSLSEEMQQDWGSEQFKTVNGDVYEVSGAKGVQVIRRACGDDHRIPDSFPFEDIINVNIYNPNSQGHTQFQINRRSNPPLFLEMEKRCDAESFACLLDGYYRLLVDYYHYLNEEVAPPSLVSLVKNRCHGPIPLSKARQKIEETSLLDGVYLIRQNPEDHFSFCLTVRIGRELKNFRINHYEDDHFGLDNQPKFRSLRAFVEHYRSVSNSRCLEGHLKKAVPIEPKERALRLLDNSALNEELPPQPETGPQIQWIRIDSLSDRDQWRLLGKSDFTQVFAADFRKPLGNRRTRRMRVAIKCPEPNAPTSVQQKFSHSVDLMSSWQHKHIIRFEGIGAGYMLVMEYATQGPLDNYISSLEEREFGPASQLLAAFQLIDALEYLESRRLIHGNVSAHNTLVVSGAPRLHIKLGDPMLAVFYHSLEMNRQEKLKRVRWTAPELLATNSEPTLAGDKYSYAITLWQIMSHGARPADDLRDEEVREHYRQGARLAKPASCPDEMYNIMEQCWSHNPRNRPPCRGILRDVNSLLQNLISEDHPYALVRTDHEEVELIPEDTEEEEILEQNDANLARDAISSQNSAGDSAEGMGEAAGAVGHTSILDNIAKALNQNMEPDFDHDEEARFFGVDKIPDGMLKIGEKLGAGHFGMVYKGKLKNHLPGYREQDVAVKIIKPDRKDSRPEQFQQEIKAMSRCDHKNIVKVLGYCEDKTNRLQLVMEYFPLGSLEKYLREKNNQIPHKTLYLFGQQICQGMKYLHEMHRMVHRDLAARNVLVANESEVRITDFGLARIFGEDKDYYRAKESNQKVPIKWYAPEWLRHNKYQKESDVWSLGIILWEMFSYGQDPIYRDAYGKQIEHSKLLDYFDTGGRLTPPPSCPKPIWVMMTDCWHMDPAKRPRFSELIGRLRVLIQEQEC